MLLGKDRAMCGAESVGLRYRVRRGTFCHPMFIVTIVPDHGLNKDVCNRKFERELVGTTFVRLHLTGYS